MKHARSRTMTVAVAAGLLALVAACSPSPSGNSAGSSSGGSKTPLTLLFGSSGPAETKAVQDAAAAFTKSSGIKVNVIAASNLQQQLAQGFAGGNPPDVSYLDPGSFQNYAKQGALYPYPSQLANAGDFYPALRASFTYQGEFECEPKDASTLALYINTQDWQQAGLTSADIPTTWDQLKTVAAKLTTNGRAGLVTDFSHSGLDQFLYQNGGTVVGSDGKVNLTSSQDVAALTYLKGLLASGDLAFPSQLGAGWNGEAFGKDKASMAIVGNWMVGALQADYQSIQYQVAPLPAGPCWPSTPPNWPTPTPTSPCPVTARRSRPSTPRSPS